MFRSVAATANEHRRGLAGDDLIDDPIGSLTHAPTVRASTTDVWGWVAQMGAGTRAGWYSYDLLDNARVPSATRLVPELQRLEVGMVFPALPDATDGFVLVRVEPAEFLVLGWLAPRGPWLVSWAFVLESLAPRTTRLIVRARAGQGYRLRGVPRWATRTVVPLVHFVMQRRQLLRIAARAERLAGDADAKSTPRTGRATEATTLAARKTGTERL